MGYLWELDRDSEGLTGFVRKLGYDLEDLLRKKSSRAEVFPSELDRTNGSEGWILRASLAGCVVGEIMVTPSREDKRPGALTIDRFQGVKTSDCNYATESLVKAAETYNDVTTFLQARFGSMISSHDGRDIYRAFLEQPAPQKVGAVSADNS